MSEKLHKVTGTSGEVIEQVELIFSQRQAWPQDRLRNQRPEHARNSPKENLCSCSVKSLASNSLKDLQEYFGEKINYETTVTLDGR